MGDNTNLEGEGQKNRVTLFVDQNRLKWWELWSQSQIVRFWSMIVWPLRFFACPWYWSTKVRRSFNSFCSPIVEVGQNLNSNPTTFGLRPLTLASRLICTSVGFMNVWLSSLDVIFHLLGTKNIYLSSTVINLQMLRSKLCCYWVSSLI